MGRTLPNAGEGTLESTLAPEQGLSDATLVVLRLGDLVTQWEIERVRAERVGESAVAQAYKLVIRDTQWTLGRISEIKGLQPQEVYTTEPITYLLELAYLARRVDTQVSTDKEYNELYCLTQTRLHKQILLTLGEYAHPE